ncbi:MAG: oxidoreductase domain protein [Phycisphaerales bacterium]|nr:oxidoreductase domain protein [Phycisphaerales bacterium]
MNHSTFSRRDLLKHTAAGAAGIALASAMRPALADAVASSPVSQSPATLRWGIIGTGTRGASTHIPVLKEAPESQIVALCDVSEKRLAAAASKVGGTTATYSDYQKLLASPDINAVVIAAPNLFHREMLLAAIQAGKHVLCEKPAGVGPADAAAMKRAVDASKTLVMFGMQYRNNAQPRKIAEMIAAGDIGKPRYIVQNCSRGDWNTSPNVWQYADPKLGGKPMNWRFSHAASGGTLNEFDCHYFDILHWLAGSTPEQISCEGGISVYHDGRDTWDHASVTLRYPNDVTAVHTLCLFGPGRADLSVTGEEGAIETAGDSLRFTRFAKRGAGKSRVEDVRPAIPPGHSADHSTLGLYEDFLACIKTGKKPEAGVDRAVAASRTCWLAELASERKAAVKWDEIAA